MAIEHHNSKIAAPADVSGYPMDIYNNSRTYLDSKFSCIPWISKMVGYSWERDLAMLKHYISSEVAKYNLAYGARIYFEGSIPNSVYYKPFWDRWYTIQISAYIDFDLKSSNTNEYITNMFIKSVCYKEAIDNQLVVGADILSLIYMYNKILSVSKDNYSSLDAYQKLWQFRSEAIKLFAPFYDKHDEACKKYDLLHNGIDHVKMVIKDKIQSPELWDEDINRLNYRYGYKNFFLAERDSGVIPNKDNFKPFKVFTPNISKHHKYMNLDGVD